MSRFAPLHEGGGVTKWAQGLQTNGRSVFASVVGVARKNPENIWNQFSMATPPRADQSPLCL